MINLLPPDIQTSLGYTRKNTKLRRLAIGLATLLAAIVLTFFGGLIYLKQTSKALSKQVEISKNQLALQDQANVKKQVEDLSGTLKLVAQVLSKEVLFSKLLKQVGSVMPVGSVLTALSINQLSGGLDLQAKATDYQTATQVQLNLQDPKSVLFEKVDIVNVQCQSISTADPIAAKYPCTVQMRALFSKTNPFLFISPTGVKP
jgi:Tfp pilus assembly protein PilN